MILIVDNYDSFVETLARYVREEGAETRVVRNDALTPAEIVALRPRAVLLSPGPYAPSRAGVCKALPEALPTTPILGVCLGHLAVAEAYGGRIVGAREPIHGRATAILHDGAALFAGVPYRFDAGRYHALIADISQTELRATAWSEDGAVMAFAHPRRPHQGVQFHPESVLTPDGRTMIRNFLAGIAA